MASTLYFIAGLILLFLSGDALVRGAVSLANRFHVPPIIIGLTIISMGTSAPELFVSLQAAFEGAPGLAVGNAIGSNIANAMVVLGLPALIAPLVFTAPGIKRSALFMVGVSLGFAFISVDGMISSMDGILLVAALVIYLLYSVLAASKARQKKLDARLANPEELDIAEQTDGLVKSLVFLGLGFVGLAIGAKLIVDGALGLAAIWGIGETVVGTTIVALGTTLPEIAATLAASFRGQAGVAIGNVIGSNIFNLLGILGITAILIPLPVAVSLLQFDLWVLLATSALLIPLAFMRRPLGKIFGAALTGSYLFYLFLSFT